VETRVRQRFRTKRVFVQWLRVRDESRSRNFEHPFDGIAALDEAISFLKSSGPLGPLQPVSKVGHFTKGAIWLKVNGEAKQNANLEQMIWSVAEQVSKLSAAFELMPGDIIFSGTPENVGPVVKGDVMDAHIDGLPDIRVKVV